MQPMPTSAIHDSTRTRPEAAHDAPASVLCFWCERPHAGEHALSVCPECVDRYANLRSLEMNGSHPLDDAAIDRALDRRSAGNYALGYLDADVFTVFYVGRSDSDVRRSLHEWVDRPSLYQRYAPTGRAAWASGPMGSMSFGAPALGCVGPDIDSRYTRFAFSYATSAEAAFEKECRNYDDFGGCGGLDNEAPPVWRP